ncbi:MAG TPA: WbqC family protein [Dongiaceae bacterium]|nr:WbqC family protein [Dongiaceae bacterium]
MGAFRGPAGTTAVVLQPSYLPWRGYFDLVDRADVFVFYDDVQYDKHGWRNRNRVKTANGPAWITVPVHAHGAVERGTPICEIAIDHRRDWVRAHLETLRHAYGRQPFYARYAPLLAAILEKRHARLADLTIELTVAVARELGSATRFVRASGMALHGRKNDRLLDVLEAVGATRYVSGPSARSYIAPERFAEAGIALEYAAYDYPEYAQAHPPYEPAVSIVDALFALGPAAIENIRARRIPEALIA